MLQAAQWLKRSRHKFKLHQFLRQLNKHLTTNGLKKHGYLVASSWSGKSELIKLLVYRELIKPEPKEAVILLDPHGDMAQEIAQFNEFSHTKYANRLVFIDPSLKQGYSPSINPFQLEFKTESNIALMTQELLSIINVLLQWLGQSNSWTPNQWASTTNQMDAILSPCIATLLRCGNSSFSDLQRFMDDNNNADLLALGQQSPNPQHRLLFRHKFNSPLFSATKHGIYTRLQVILNDPTFQNLISNTTTINLKQLIEEKKIILFKLSLGNAWSDSVQAYGRFIVGLLRIIALQRTNIAVHKRVPILLFIDEFQNFISSDIEKALTQLRKYGLHLMLANQYVWQQISSALQKTLFASGVTIAGKNEKKSLGLLANEMELTVDELKQLNTGEFYLQAANYPPIKIKTPKYLLWSKNAMPSKHRYNLIKQNLQRYYSKLKPHDAHSDLTHEINNQKHNQYYVSQQQISPNTQLENLHSKYQLEWD